MWGLEHRELTAASCRDAVVVPHLAPIAICFALPVDRGPYSKDTEKRGRWLRAKHRTAKDQHPASLFLLIDI